MQQQPLSRKEERFERILEEATRLFVEKGYEQTTISDVVKACEMARGTFYLYFDSLEQVLTELYARVMKLLWEQVEANTDGMHNHEEAAIAKIIRSVYRLLNQRRELLFLFFRSGGQEFEAYKYRMIRDQIGKPVAELIQQNTLGCDTRPCSPELVSLMITTLVNHMAFYTEALQADGYAQQMIEQELIDFILYGVSPRNLA